MDIAREFKGYSGVFAKRLREVMEETKTTQEGLAKQTGMTRQTISQYMDGSVLPNIEKLYKICAYFNVPSDYFLGRTNSKSEDISYQQMENTTGLSSDVLKTTADEHRKGLNKLYVTRDTPVGLLNYVLLQKNFIADFYAMIKDFSIERYNEREDSSKHPHYSSKASSSAKLIVFITFMVQLAEECHKNFFEQLADEQKEKRKPGRKRTVEISQRENSEV